MANPIDPKSLLYKETVKKIKNQISLFVTKHNRIASGSRDWDRYELSPCRHTIKKYTGKTINEILSELGYNDPLPSIKEWTPKEIRGAVTAIAMEYVKLGKPVPGSREWERLNLQPTKPTIRKYLKMGINTLLIDLGFEVNTPHKSYTRNELIDYLYKYETILKRQPIADDFRTGRPKGFPSIMSYYYHFESFQEACRLAGFDSNRGYRKEFLYQRIWDFIEEFGRTPYEHELDGRDRPTGYPKGSTYTHHFGSVEICLYQLGLTFTTKNIMHWNKDNVRSTFLKEVHFFVNRYNRCPTRQEWDAHHLSPCRGIIRKILGVGYNEILLSINCSPSYNTPSRYSDTALLLYLRHYFETTLVPPTVDAFKKNSSEYPDPINYQRRFGSWDNAMILAGFDPNSGSYGKRSISQDGHVCDSIWELQIDNYLCHHDIPHEKDVCYAYHPILNTFGSKRCDFLLTNHSGEPVYIEFAGIKTEKYLNNIKTKIDLSKELNFSLIIIYPKDIHQLDIIFSNWIESKY